MLTDFPIIAIELDALKIDSQYNYIKQLKLVINSTKHILDNRGVPYQYDYLMGRLNYKLDQISETLSYNLQELVDKIDKNSLNQPSLDLLQNICNSLNYYFVGYRINPLLKKLTSQLETIAPNHDNSQLIVKFNNCLQSLNNKLLSQQNDLTL